MKVNVRRNVIVFEAPKELSERAKEIAEETMVSTSAIYRMAIKAYCRNYIAEDTADRYVQF
jgi:predicted transcriptional regulator